VAVTVRVATAGDAQRLADWSMENDSPDWRCGVDAIPDYDVVSTLISELTDADVWEVSDDGATVGWAAVKSDGRIGWIMARPDAESYRAVAEAVLKHAHEGGRDIPIHGRVYSEQVRSAILGIDGVASIRSNVLVEQDDSRRRDVFKGRS
jgi:hypothetical protein